MQIRAFEIASSNRADELICRQIAWISQRNFRAADARV